MKKLGLGRKLSPALAVLLAFSSMTAGIRAEEPEETAEDISEENVQAEEAAADDGETAVSVRDEVEYVDAQGSPMTPENAVLIDADTTEWSEEWYAVRGEVTFSDRVNVSGENVNLILCDGAELNSENGIYVKSGTALTIWQQTEGSGTLNVSTSYRMAGIGGVSTAECGAVTINGGIIRAYGGDSSAGIGSGRARAGTVVINGGDVYAEGGKFGAGIGCGNAGTGGTVTITGGTVEAVGGTSSAGIGGARNGGSGGTITITGGKVTARGGEGGAGIGGGELNTQGGGTISITGGEVRAQGGTDACGIGPGRYGSSASVSLGYENRENLIGITSDSYGGEVVLTKGFMDKETGMFFGLTGEADTEAMAGKTLVPAVLTVTFMSDDIVVETQSVPYGETAYMPEDPVKEGYLFLGWQLDGSDYDFDKPVREPVTLHAVWEKISRPFFSGHQLVLSGTLGLRFGIAFPQDFDTEGSYMVFTVNGQEQKIYTGDAGLKDGKRIFTCYLNSLQMAEEIMAVLHYGDDQTVTATYSLADYFDYFDEHEAGYSTETLNLVHAAADYGYYAQPYLFSLHNLEDQYVKITKHYADSFDYDAVKQNTAQYTFAKGISDSAVSAASYKLSLDADTALSVMVKDPAGTEVSASAEFGGKTYEMTQDSDTVWSVKIPGIKASQLGDAITVSGTAGGDFTINVSALSYVRSVLNSSKFDEKAKNAVCALYQYYSAVKEYLPAE